jgi:hypothetical protein
VDGGPRLHIGRAIATVNRLELGRRYAERALDAGGPAIGSSARRLQWTRSANATGQICDRQRTARRATNSETMPSRGGNVEHRSRMGCVRWRLFTHCDECGSRAHPITAVAGFSARQVHSRGWSRSIGVPFGSGCGRRSGRTCRRPRARDQRSCERCLTCQIERHLQCGSLRESAEGNAP